MPLYKYTPASPVTAERDRLALGMPTPEKLEEAKFSLGSTALEMFQHDVRGVANFDEVAQHFQTLQDRIEAITSMDDPNTLPIEALAEMIIYSQKSTIMESANSQYISVSGAWLQGGEGMAFVGDGVDTEDIDSITDDPTVARLVKELGLNFLGCTVEPGRVVNPVYEDCTTHMSLGTATSDLDYVPFVTIFDERHPIAAAIIAKQAQAE